MTSRLFVDNHHLTTRMIYCQLGHQEHINETPFEIQNISIQENAYERVVYQL